jgi:predicted nucleic acid-binding protein
MKLQQETSASTGNGIPTQILLDCCTVINAIEGKPSALAFKEKMSKRKDVTLFVPDVVISQVAKVARLSAEEAEEEIRSFSHRSKIVRIKDDQKALVDAVALSVRYDYCHYPDSIYLIQARTAGAILATYDKKLRDVAKMEGIMACSPDNFRFQK